MFWEDRFEFELFVECLRVWLPLLFNFGIAPLELGDCSFIAEAEVREDEGSLGEGLR